MQTKSKRIVIKLLKITGWITASVILLLLVIIALIQIPAVQQKITQKAIAFLQEKIGTQVRLESLYISFPKTIVLKGLYLEDQSRDTLLYTGKLSINTDLWALTRNEIRLNDIDLANTTAYIKRAEADSAFNFTYILDAFAGDSTAVPDTLEQKDWDFIIKTVNLENIKAHYNDSLTGNTVDLTLGALALTLDEFDLNNYIFGVEKITLSDTRVDFLQTKLPEVSEEVAGQPVDTTTLDLNLKELELSNVQANYKQRATGQVIRLDVGETFLEANEIDLKNQRIHLSELTLKNTFLAYQQHTGKQTEEKKQTGSPAAGSSKPSSSGNSPGNEKNGWNIKLDKLNLAGNNIQFYDFTKPHTRNAIDFDHLWITNLNAEARDLLLGGADIRVDLQNFSFREKSGFGLRSFQAKVNVTADSASVKDFILTTDNSKLQFEAISGFESFRNLAETYPSASIRANIEPSYVSLRDLLYFNPTVLDSLPLRLDPYSRIHLDASINGAVNDLSIDHLVVRALSETYLSAKGTIAGLPDQKKTKMNVDLTKFFTTKNDITPILPDTLLPDSFALPKWINISGGFKGDTQKAKFKTLLATPLGSVNANGSMDLDSTSTTRGFNGKVTVNEFNLGELLMQPETIGKLNLQASVNSHGLTKEEMNSAVEATVSNFEYKGYTYETLRLNAKIQNDVFQAWASLRDKNLDFTFEGDYNFQEEVPRYDFTLDLRNANFKALNLSERPLKARGTLDVDMATADFKVLNGSAGIRKVAIFNGDALYSVDSLLFASIDQEGRSEITIDSDIMAGNFEGSINIFTMPAVLREYFNNYYSLHDSVKQSHEAPQHFTFRLDLKKTDLITDILVPELSSFEPGEIRGGFDSKAKRLDLRFDIAKIRYSNIGIESFLFSTNSDSVKLNYNVFVDEISVDSLRIDGLEFNGTVAHDSILTNIIVLDSLEVYKYVLGGTFFSHEKEFALRLDPTQVRLNYEDWSVPKNNYIHFGGEKLIAENVELVNGRKKIIFESNPQPGSPLHIGFRELNLEYLFSMVAREKPLSGLLHGDINIFPDKEDFQFTSDIRIDDLSISQTPWGDLTLAVQQKMADRFDVNFSLLGDQNDIRAEGYYTAGERSAMDLTATITSFNLSALQPLATGQVQQLKGNLTGEIHAGGSPQAPDISGEVTFRNTAFFSTYLNSAFSINNETIEFTDRGISFSRFQLVDSRNNIATLDGLIATTNYTNFGFALDLQTSNFRLLNTTEKDNDLFYGRMDVNANARIRGTMLNPAVDMEVSLSDGSHLTYIVPQSEAGVMEQQGIVKFVDKSFKGDPFIKKIQPELSDTIKSKFTGIDLTAKIELTDQESLTVVIDPTTNDQLMVKGNTTLTLQVNQTGDIQLSGRYEISEGTYNLSFYKFVKREFKIEQGSTMTWSGDPLNAEMNINAIFEVQTSPIDLLANQLQGQNQEQLNQYKQRLPFLVYLNIGGELLQPDITFRLEMPVEKRDVLQGNVYARIQDINTRESDLNKQVFALLILKRFVADNPFESQASAGFEGTARTSVSRILTQQLNRLSENVKGVELSFDVESYEDYSSGQAQGQTELQLGLSKSLLNDRLVVKISGNVDIEGENTNREVTDYIGDLALEYKLTEDGRFRITGFRNSNYDMIDGELIETGAGLIYIKDYNSLSELFKANAKQN